MIAPSDTGIYGRLHMGPNYEMAPQGFTPVGRRCFALLKPDSDLRTVFPHGPVPITQSQPVEFQSPIAGAPTLQALLLDIARIPPAVLPALVALIMTKRKLPEGCGAEWVLAQIKADGFFPIRTDHFSAVVVVELSGGRAS